MECETAIESYPEKYRKNMRIVMDAIDTDAETTMTVMLMTAALMDLNPEDPKVAEIILDDCRSMGCEIP